MDMIAVPRYLFALLPAVGALLVGYVWAATKIWQDARKERPLAERLDRLCGLLEAMLRCGMKLEDVPALVRWMVASGPEDETDGAPVGGSEP